MKHLPFRIGLYEAQRLVTKDGWQDRLKHWLSSITAPHANTSLIQFTEPLRPIYVPVILSSVDNVQTKCYGTYEKSETMPQFSVSLEKGLEFRTVTSTVSVPVKIKLPTKSYSMWTPKLQVYAGLTYPSKDSPLPRDMVETVACVKPSQLVETKLLSDKKCATTIIQPELRQAYLERLLNARLQELEDARGAKILQDRYGSVGDTQLDTAVVKHPSFTSHERLFIPLYAMDYGNGVWSMVNGFSGGVHHDVSLTTLSWVLSATAVAAALPVAGVSAVAGTLATRIAVHAAGGLLTSSAASELYKKWNGSKRSQQSKTEQDQNEQALLSHGDKSWFRSVSRIADTGERAKTAFQVMDITATEFDGMTKEDLKRKYHSRVIHAHPDKGGSDLEMTRLQDAYEALLKLVDK